MTLVGLRFWDGSRWMRERRKEVTLLRLDELAAFARANGIPGNAQFGATPGGDESPPEAVLTWYVPEEGKP